MSKLNKLIGDLAMHLLIIEFLVNFFPVCYIDDTNVTRAHSIWNVFI